MLMDSIFEKLSKNETLTDLERSEYLSFMKRLQTTVITTEKQTQQGGAAELAFPVINSPIWGSPPLHPLVASMQTDMTVTSGAADEYITFDEFFDRSSVFSIDSTNQKILISSLNTFLAFGGVVQWEGNATGFRALYVEGFTSTDVSLGQGIMHSFQGFAGVENWMPFYFLFDPLNFATLSYFKVRAYQNSGGDLLLKSVNLGINVC